MTRSQTVAVKRRPPAPLAAALALTTANPARTRTRIGTRALHSCRGTGPRAVECRVARGRALSDRCG